MKIFCKVFCVDRLVQSGTVPSQTGTELLVFVPRCDFRGRSVILVKMRFFHKIEPPFLYNTNALDKIVKQTGMSSFETLAYIQED